METAERLQFPFSTTPVLCTRSFPGAREHMLHEDRPVSVMAGNLLVHLVSSDFTVVVALAWFYSCETFTRLTDFPRIVSLLET